MLQAAAVYVRGADADPGHDVALSETEPTMRRLIALDGAEREEVLEAVERYNSHLVALGLRDVDVVPGNTTIAWSGGDGSRPPRRWPWPRSPWSARPSTGRPSGS